MMLKLALSNEGLLIGAGLSTGVGAHLIGEGYRENISIAPSKAMKAQKKEIASYRRLYDKSALKFEDAKWKARKYQADANRHFYGDSNSMTKSYHELIGNLKQDAAERFRARAVNAKSDMRASQRYVNKGLKRLNVAINEALGSSGNALRMSRAVRNYVAPAIVVGGLGGLLLNG